MPSTDADIERLERICRAVVEPLGFDLILVEWTTDRGRRILRLYIDHEDAGVTLDDCAHVSRHLSRVLDVEDIISHAYSLEVSTPGLDRPLAREKDFARFVGNEARVRLRNPLPSGRKRVRGILRRAADGIVEMDIDGERISFALSDVAKANLVYQGEFECNRI